MKRIILLIKVKKSKGEKKENECNKSRRKISSRE